MLGQIVSTIPPEHFWVSRTDISSFSEISGHESGIAVSSELFLGVNDRTKDGMGCFSSYDLHVPMYWSVFFNAGLFIATGLVFLCAMADIFSRPWLLYICNPLKFARKKRVMPFGRFHGKRLVKIQKS